MKIDYRKKQIKEGNITVAEPPKEETRKVSTGSLTFDLITEGGFSPGIIRFMGSFEGGKTSAAVEVANNFLDIYKEKGRVLFLKVEMRLSYDMQARSRRPFVVMKPGNELEALESWSHENIFVYTQNVFPEISKFLYGVLQSLAPDEKLFVILDSVDWLKIHDNIEDFLDQKSNQPADVAKYMKQFLKNFGPMFTENGHYILFVSQVSSKIKIDKYATYDQKETVAVGGNALLHAADWIFQFKPKSEIKEKDGSVDETDNPILGSMIKIKIFKSTNETTGYSFEYPVKIKSGVWREKELVDKLVAFEVITRGGSWYTLPEKTVTAIKNKFSVDIPPKVQGEKKLLAFFEENPIVTNYMFDMMRKALSIGKISKYSILKEFTEDEEEEDEGNEVL